MNPTEPPPTQAGLLKRKNLGREGSDLITAARYLQLYEKAKDQPTSIEYKIYTTLTSYELNIATLKQELQSVEQKFNALQQEQSKLENIPQQPLDENEVLQTNTAAFRGNKEKMKELAELIDEKIQQEAADQRQFFNLLKTGYEEELKKATEATHILERIVARKLIKPYFTAFNVIRGDEEKQRNRMNQIRNGLTALIHRLNDKVKGNVQYSFRAILKDMGLSSINQHNQSSLKLKGKVLMGLKEYPRINKRHAFYSWYLRTTSIGESLLKKSADNLVLYTNINKTTQFYRLFKVIMLKRNQVTPPVKRMAMMFYLFTRIFVGRQKQEFFEKFKIIAGKEGLQSVSVNKLIEFSNNRKKETLKYWMKTVQAGKEKDNEKQKGQTELCQRIIDYGKNKMIECLKVMKKASDADQLRERNKKELLKGILMILAKTKIGRVFSAWERWKNLPERKDQLANVKGNKFEIGLKRFVNRTLNRAFAAFKNQLQLGGATKKRAVIQIINATVGSQKKIYLRWLAMTEKAKFIKECQLITKVFNTVNFTIKSVASNALATHNEKQIVERALMKIFTNMNYAVDISLRKWRNVNQVQKLRNRMTEKQKEGVLKVLNGLLHNNKINKIRDAVNKFRLNLKISAIRRHFMRRILMAEAGLVQLAFRAFVSLPERKRRLKHFNGSQLEDGLMGFVNRTLSRAFEAFRNQFQIGQAIKKRAVIQIMTVTMGNQKKMYNKWIAITEKSKLFKECKLITSTFNLLNYTIKSVSDNVFQSTNNTQIVQKALNLIFKNVWDHHQLFFQRWRDINNKEGRTIFTVPFAVTGIQKLRHIVLQIHNKRIRNCIFAWKGNWLTSLKQGKNHQEAERKKMDLCYKIIENARRKMMKCLTFIKVSSIPKEQTRPQKPVEDVKPQEQSKPQDQSKLDEQRKRQLLKTLLIFMKNKKVTKLVSVWERFKNLPQRTEKEVNPIFVKSFFNAINTAIKSVASHAFVTNNHKQILKRALAIIADKFSRSRELYFKRWINTFQIEKLRILMDARQKQSALKVLNNLITHSKASRIREIIYKFRLNSSAALKTKSDQQQSQKKRLAICSTIIQNGKRKMKECLRLIRLKSAHQPEPKPQEETKVEGDNKRQLLKTLLIIMMNKRIAKVSSGWEKLKNLPTREKKQEVNPVLIRNFFVTVNNAIKSVASNAILHSNHRQIIAAVLIRIIDNMQNNAGSCLKRWRSVNQIQKLRESLKQQRKQSLLKVLVGLVKNNKLNQMREVINRFRINVVFQLNQRCKNWEVEKNKLLICYQLVQNGKRKMKQCFSLLKSREEESAPLPAEILPTNQQEMPIDETPNNDIKYSALVRIINCIVRVKNNHYQRLIDFLRQRQTQHKCSLFQRLFLQTSSSMSKYILPMFMTSQKRAYSFDQMTTIKLYLQKILDNRLSNSKKAFQVLHRHYIIKKQNRWFKKSSQILALNTHINPQKSFWRLRYNIYSTGITHNAAIIVKLKKMYHTLRKFYELSMYKIFLAIDKYGKTKTEIQITQEEPSTRQNYHHHQHNRSHTEANFSLRHRSAEKQVKRFVFVNVTDKESLNSPDTLADNLNRFVRRNRTIAMQLIDRVFSKHLKKQINTWRKNTQNTDYQNEDQLEQCLDERIKLINKQNIFMEEIDTMKEENEQLTTEVAMREKDLNEANETVALLSLRINSMITDKFVGIIVRVEIAVGFRNLNDGFDEIIQQANINYERDANINYEGEEYIISSESPKGSGDMQGEWPQSMDF